MLALRTCLLVPSPQSTMYVDCPRVSAIQVTFLRRLGLPEEVPSQVTDSSGAAGLCPALLLLPLRALSGAAAAACVDTVELLVSLLLLATGLAALLEVKDCLAGCTLLC